MVSPAVASAVVLFRQRFRCPSPVVPASAKSVRGAGQGRICGIPTTRKDARSVVVKREVVHRDRGCR